MGVGTKIEWTEATWNPIIGCSRVSEGCRNCYAEVIAGRFGNGKKTVYSGLTQITNGRSVWTGKIVETRKLLEPLSWRTPKRVFVNSMSDLFHENVTDEQRDRIFAVMALCPQHTFQVLTKRPERMLAYISGVSQRGGITELVASWYIEDPPRAGKWPFTKERAIATGLNGWPCKNVWLGVSVENQATADQRIPLLLQTPAAVRFISAEPLLDFVDLSTNVGGTRWIGGQRGCLGEHHGAGTATCPRELHHHHDDMCGQGLDWVICGGESGPGSRPCRLAWLSLIVRQCQSASVPVFVKQLGGNIPDGDQDYIQRVTGKSVHDRKGGDIEEFPPELRVREYPKEKTSQ